MEASGGSWLGVYTIGFRAFEPPRVRPCLEEADRRICSHGRTVGIETEIIQSPPTQRVRILVLLKGLRAPTQRVGGLTWGPDRVAVSSASLCSVVGNSRVVRRCVKLHIGQRSRASQGDTEGLDSAIQILVVDGVFIMPNPGGWVRHFVGNERAAIDSRLGLDRIDGRSGPGIDGRGSFAPWFQPAKS